MYRISKIRKIKKSYISGRSKEVLKCAILING